MNSHRNAHGTRPAAALNSLTSPIPMSLCKELETSVFRCQELLSKPVPAPETPCQPVPHGNVAPVTPPLFRSIEAMPSTPAFQCFSRRRDSARDAACGKLETCLLNLRHHSQFLSHVRCPARLQFHPRCPRILLSRLKFHPRCSQILLLRSLTRIPLVHTITFQRNLMRKSAVDTQSDDPFKFDDPPVPTPVIPSQCKSRV